LSKERKEKMLFSAFHYFRNFLRYPQMRKKTFELI